MKKVIAGLVFALAGAHAMAGNLICRLADPSLASSVGSTYGLRVQDTTQGAPFVLFQAPNGVPTSFYQAIMATDLRVVWVEDDGKLSAPESEGLSKLPAKGSTLPAVGDRISLQGL